MVINAEILLNLMYKILIKNTLILAFPIIAFGQDFLMLTENLI